MQQSPSFFSLSLQPSNNTLFSSFFIFFYLLPPKAPNKIQLVDSTSTTPCHLSALAPSLDPLRSVLVGWWYRSPSLPAILPFFLHRGSSHAPSFSSRVAPTNPSAKPFPLPLQQPVPPPTIHNLPPLLIKLLLLKNSTPIWVQLKVIGFGSKLNQDPHSNKEEKEKRSGFQDQFDPNP